MPRPCDITFPLVNNIDTKPAVMSLSLAALYDYPVTKMTKANTHLFPLLFFFFKYHLYMHVPITLDACHASPIFAEREASENWKMHVHHTCIRPLNQSE